METEINSSEFIKNALKKYDEQNMKYFELVNHQDISINQTDGIITFNLDKNESYTFELLAYFDNQTNIWIWAWLLLRLENNFNELSRGLLNHGLGLSPSSNTDDHYMIKSFLINSRIQIDENIQLDINLAICSSLLKDKISFIYKRRRPIDESNGKYITLYYLIKKKY
jgi:hypothetical protein